MCIISGHVLSPVPSALTIGFPYQEFKLNPNAKSFTPLTSPRPHHPPAPDATYYYPNNMGATGPGLPVGMGVSFYF